MKRININQKLLNQKIINMTHNMNHQSKRGNKTLNFTARYVCLINTPNPIKYCYAPHTPNTSHASQLSVSVIVYFSPQCVRW